MPAFLQFQRNCCHQHFCCNCFVIIVAVVVLCLLLYISQLIYCTPLAAFGLLCLLVFGPVIFLLLVLLQYFLPTFIVVGVVAQLLFVALRYFLKQQLKSPIDKKKTNLPDNDNILEHTLDKFIRWMPKSIWMHILVHNK